MVSLYKYVTSTVAIIYVSYKSYTNEHLIEHALTTTTTPPPPPTTTTKQ